MTDPTRHKVACPIPVLAQAILIVWRDRGTSATDIVAGGRERFIRALTMMDGTWPDAVRTPTRDDLSAAFDLIAEEAKQ